MARQDAQAESRDRAGPRCGHWFSLSLNQFLFPHVVKSNFGIEDRASY